MQILVVDIGGTYVKILVSGARKRRKFPSGPALTPAQTVAGVKSLADDWRYDAVSVGYPGPLVNHEIEIEPRNLGRGWPGFDFAAAFGRPVRLLNDAAMQALGGYRGGRMLFLGLGTGLGTAIIDGGMVQPMELAHEPFRDATYEHYVGRRARERMGREVWRQQVYDVVTHLSATLAPDDILIGGGKARLLDDLPPRCRLGSNADAFEGGFRLWAPTTTYGPTQISIHA